MSETAAPDPVAAELGWLRDCIRTIVTGLDPEAFDLEAVESHLTCAVAALEAVLDLHQPGIRDGGTVCLNFDHADLFPAWPCAEYRAISAALLGEGGTGG